MSVVHVDEVVAPLNALAYSEPVNAIIGWALTGIMILGVIESFLTNALLWGGLTFLIVTVTLLPAWATDNWMRMVPWPLLLISAGAVLIRSFGIYLEIAGYLAVATLALIAVVELDAFTSIEMSRRFAIGFAVLTTLAIQGLWTIAQYYSDLWLGTEFLHSQQELQVDIVIVTTIAIAIGLVFEWYFDRIEHIGSHKRPISSSGSNDSR